MENRAPPISHHGSQSTRCRWPGASASRRGCESRRRSSARAPSDSRRRRGSSPRRPPSSRAARAAAGRASPTDERVRGQAPRRDQGQLLLALRQPEQSGQRDRRPVGAARNDRRDRRDRGDPGPGRAADRARPRRGAGAARGNANTAVLAAAGDQRVGPVLQRVTRTRVAFLTRLYGDLGLPAEEATRYARLAYALYLGIGELRRADPDADLAGPELAQWLDLAMQPRCPPRADRGACSARDRSRFPSTTTPQRPPGGQGCEGYINSTYISLDGVIETPRTGLRAPSGRRPRRGDPRAGP